MYFYLFIALFYLKGCFILAPTPNLFIHVDYAVKFKDSFAPYSETFNYRIEYNYILIKL